MPKFKIINYKPYEYELLLNELNQLGQEGYQTDDLSFFTFFKKTNKKYYYKIDFYTPQGKKRQEKKDSKIKFLEPYLKEKYKPIYNKNGMYVFIGEKKSKIKFDLSSKKDFVNSKRLFKYLYLALTSMIMSILFLVAAFQAININTFITYGLTFIFIGLIFLFITITYRCMSNMNFMSDLKLKIYQKDNKISIQRLKNRRKLYLGLTILSVICLVGGLAEDTMNPSSFSTQDHPILSLKDLGIKEETILKTQMKSSFTVPKSYSSLESIDDKISLFIKEYVLSSENAAKTLLNDLEKKPEEYYCTSTKREKNILYGLSDKKISTVIIQKEKKVILITPSFNMTDHQLQITIDFYNKSISST